MKNILDLLKLTDKGKINGVWISGVYREGEFKIWYDNGQIREHIFYKNKQKHGEHKIWSANGQIWEHSLWREGDYIEMYVRSGGRLLEKRE